MLEQNEALKETLYEMTLQRDKDGKTAREYTSNKKAEEFDAYQIVKENQPRIKEIIE